MDDLVRQIAERTGIAPAQAQQAVEMVLSYAQTHLPAPVAAQLEGALRGGGSGFGDQAQEHLGKLGGLFGK